MQRSNAIKIGEQVSRIALEALFDGSYRDLIHETIVTGRKVDKCIANANVYPADLLAGLEIMATNWLININRAKLGKLIDHFFNLARIDLEIPDRICNLDEPRECWFIPLAIIDEAVAKILEVTVVNLCIRYQISEPRAALTYRSASQPRLVN